jgi:hypothetical protein
MMPDAWSLPRFAQANPGSLISDPTIRTSTPKTKRFEQKLAKEAKGTQTGRTPPDRTGKEYSTVKPRAEWREVKGCFGWNGSQPKPSNHPVCI